MRADGLMARSASSADESKSARPSLEDLSESERHSLFTEMANELLSCDRDAASMQRYPYGSQVGYAAEMLEGMCEGIKRNTKLGVYISVRDAFDPKKSLTENARPAEEALTVKFMNDGLSEDESDGEWYLMRGGQSRIPEYLDVVVFASYLASVSEKEKHAGRMRKVIKNGMTKEEIDNLMSLCPMFKVSTDKNGEKQIEYRVVRAGEMREMMKNRAIQKEPAKKPSDDQDSEPESSHPAEVVEYEAEGLQKPLSGEEQTKLINRILHDAVYNRADREDPNEFTVSMALHILNSAVQDGQGFGFLRGVYVPERSIEDNVSKAVQKLTAEFVEDGIGDRTDGRWYALDTNSADSLKEAVVAEILSAYLCNPEKAAEARRMIAEGLSDDQKDGIMLKGKHLGFTYRHGRVRWSLIGEERLQEGAKPFSLKERLDFVTDLREDLQDQKGVGDEDFDVRKRKEELATALEYLQEEISAAMDPGYLPDEEREFLEKQFSERPVWRPEITPELYLSRVLFLKALGAEQSLKYGWTDQPDDYRIKKLAHSIYREFGDEEAAGRTDKIEWAYNQNIRLRKIAENGNVQEFLKLVD